MQESVHTNHHLLRIIPDWNITHGEDRVKDGERCAWRARDAYAEGFGECGGISEYGAAPASAVTCKDEPEAPLEEVARQDGDASKAPDEIGASELKFALALMYCVHGRGGGEWICCSSGELRRRRLARGDSDDNELLPAPRVQDPAL